MEQGKGGPKDITKLHVVLWSLSCNGILAQTKNNATMLQVVARCPKVCIRCKGVQIPSILGSGSEFSIIFPAYFDEHLLPKVKNPMGEKAMHISYFILL